MILHTPLNITVDDLDQLVDPVLDTSCGSTLAALVLESGGNRWGHSSDTFSALCYTPCSLGCGLQVAAVCISTLFNEGHLSWSQGHTVVPLPVVASCHGSNPGACTSYGSQPDPSGHKIPFYKPPSSKRLVMNLSDSLGCFL